MLRTALKGYAYVTIVSVATSTVYYVHHGMIAQGFTPVRATIFAATSVVLLVAAGMLAGFKQSSASDA
jgi:predicted neutral ceramidase superfamily lipid hydrolase